MTDNEAFTTADLQSFVDFVFNNYAENTAGFIKRSEKLITESLHSYTQSIAKLDDQGTIALVEQYAGEILDAISEGNRNYLKNGMKIGARLLMDLLGI